MLELYKNTSGLSTKNFIPSTNDLLLKHSMAKFNNTDVTMHKEAKLRKYFS